MAARKTKSRSHLISVIFTSVLAPLTVTMISTTVKPEAVIEAPQIIVRTPERPHDTPHETPATLLPPIGSTVSAFRGISADDHAQAANHDR